MPSLEVDRIGKPQALLISDEQHEHRGLLTPTIHDFDFGVANGFMNAFPQRGATHNGRDFNGLEKHEFQARPMT